MTTSSEVKNEIQAKGKLVLDVVNDDSLTSADKRTRVEQIENDIKELTAKHADLKHIEDARSRYAGAAQDVEPEEKSAGGSYGEQFINSDQFQRAIKGWSKGQRIATGGVNLKATMTQAASAIVQPQLQSGVVPILEQRLTIEQLLATGQTNSSTVRYLKETTATNAAAAVAEEGLKPESTLVLDEVDEPVRKIATTLKVTDEMLEDFAQVRSYIDGRLSLFVQQEVEDQLLNGSGVSPNLTGLRNRSGLQTDVAYTTGHKADSIYTMITNIRANAFLEPDGIVMHPSDWADIATMKVNTDEYAGAGPFAGDPTPRLWGLPVVVTTAITAGTALVGAFRTGAQVFNRSGVTVEATNSNENDFLYNRVAFRAERRLALAVYRAGAFGEVTGL